jgi:hypothetical protein
MVITSPLYAFNLSFLDDSPSYYFTQSDWVISQKTAMNALNNAGDNVKVNWSNPQTGAHGYFMPFNTTIQQGRKCRKLKIFSEAHKVTGLSTYQFCNINGQWKIPG